MAEDTNSNALLPYLSHLLNTKDDDTSISQWYQDPYNRDEGFTFTRKVEGGRVLMEQMSARGWSSVRNRPLARWMTMSKGIHTDYRSKIRQRPRRHRQEAPDETPIGETPIGETLILQTVVETALDGDVVDDNPGDGDVDEMGEVERRILDGMEIYGQIDFEDKSVTETLQSTQRTSPSVQKRLRPARPANKVPPKDTRKIKEYFEYTANDLCQAARRFDLIYGSKENLYELAEQKKREKIWRARIEEPFPKYTKPSPEEKLTPEERRTREEETRKEWAKREKERHTNWDSRVVEHFCKFSWKT